MLDHAGARAKLPGYLALISLTLSAFSPDALELPMVSNFIIQKIRRRTNSIKTIVEFKLTKINWRDYQEKLPIKLDEI